MDQLCIPRDPRRPKTAQRPPQVAAEAPKGTSEKLESVQNTRGTHDLGNGMVAHELPMALGASI
eukprot:7829837-Pyramimonas_sp.AAC.1